MATKPLRLAVTVSCFIIFYELVKNLTWLWTGIKVMQIRLIFTPVLPSLSGHVFLYGEFFKFSHLHQETINGSKVFKPAPHIDMFLVERHNRSGGNRIRMGDIVRLTDVREVVELVPRYGQRMDDRFNSNTSLELADSFYLNNFADKETFHAILSYQ